MVRSFASHQGISSFREWSPCSLIKESCL